MNVHIPKRLNRNLATATVALRKKLNVATKIALR